MARVWHMWLLCFPRIRSNYDVCELRTYQGSKLLRLSFEYILANIASILQPSALSLSPRLEDSDRIHFRSVWGHSIVISSTNFDTYAYMVGSS